MKTKEVKQRKHKFARRQGTLDYDHVAGNASDVESDERQPV